VQKYSPWEVFSTQSQNRNLPIVFIHGYLETPDVWKEYIDFFQVNYTCYTYCLPGHGVCREKEFLNWEFITNEFKDLFGTQKFHVIGHSLGGIVSLYLLDYFKNQIKSVSLFQTAYFSDSEKRIKNRIRTISLLTENPGLFLSLAFSKYKEDPTFNQEKAISRGKKMDISSLITWQKLLIARKDFTKIIESNFNRIAVFIGEKDKEILIPFNPKINGFILKDQNHLIPSIDVKKDWCNELIKHLN
jgi:pimeloyl-ACP methyl ester carboxylesterase